MEQDGVITILMLAVGLMAWIALRRTKALATALKATQARVAELEASRFDHFGRGYSPPAAPGPVPPSEAAGAAVSDRLAPPVQPVQPVPLERSAPAASAHTEAWFSPDTLAPTTLTADWLAGRGLVWVGGVALGLAGLFLIRYSIESGWFGPLARVMAGFVLGAGLIAAGEWLARRSAPVPAWGDGSAAGADGPPVTSQTALIGAGVSTLFTAGYGAYALYGLIGSLPAFVMLGAVAFAALLLALRHGSVIALIGLVGALVVPALVSAEDPAPLAFFLYLTAVVTTCLAVVRARGWWWLGWVALAGAVGWSLLWLASHHGDVDTLVTGGFACLALLAVPIGLHLVDTPAQAGSAPGRRGTPPPMMLMLAATAGAMVILFLGIQMEDYGPMALGWLGVAGGFTQWAALRQPRLVALPWLAGVTALLAYLVWLFPLPTDNGWVGLVDGKPAGHMPHALIEPAFLPYSLTGLAIAALFGVGGWFGVQRAARNWPWALLSVSVPLLVLVIAYSHTRDSALSPPWAAAALALGGVLLAATSTLHQRLDRAPGLAIAVATYAAGVTAATTLAMVMVLQDFWLTVAIAMQLPALAWIERQTRVPEMRRIALALAVVVLVRLVLNPGIAGYDIGSLPIVNGLLYGYGLPLVAFWAAQIMFRANRGEPAGADDLLAGVLEAGWIGLLVLLVSLQLRHLIGHGTITATGYEALEQGLQVAWWGGLALALMRADRHGASVILAGAWRLLAVLALGHVVIFALIDWNPLWRPFSVGAWPGFNLITLNYGVPAVLAALGAHEARLRQWDLAKRCGGIAAMVLAWLFVTLTVRHAFQGANLAVASPSDAEWYAYSALWLVYGGALLALGVRLDIASLRAASMTVIVATVVKVFIFDMSALAGLLRVASFLGLGLALVLIGWFHQTALKGLRPPPTRPPATGSLHRP